jgi:drug/metabolite transporter (DMT)-like permease
MTAQTALFIAIVVIAGQLGELSLSQTMKTVGEIKRFDPSNLLRFIGSAFRVKWMWIGIGLMAVAFFSLLALLSWENVSMVVPATAVNYVVGTMGAQFLLGEQVNKERWIGVIIVCIGVALVCV